LLAIKDATGAARGESRPKGGLQQFGDDLFQIIIPQAGIQAL